MPTSSTEYVVTLADVMEAHERALKFGVDLFVRRSGYLLTAPSRSELNRDLEQIILAAAAGRYDSVQVVSWFEQHLRPVTPDEGQ